jgi:hypothetical protein
MSWELLWEKEKELILLLEEIREKRFINEGRRKIIDIEGKTNNIFDEMPRQNFNKNASAPSQIIQQADVFQQNISLDDSDFMGCLFDLEKKLQNNNLTLPENLLLIRKPQVSQNNQTGRRTVLPSEDLKPLITKAANLSLTVFNLHQELAGDELYLCDTLTIKQANINAGGDGFKEIDGEKQELPEQPLSKTCPKRNGSWELGSWLFECVLCPVNFQQTGERFDAWQKFLSEIKTKNKSGEQSNA